MPPTSPLSAAVISRLVHELRTPLGSLRLLGEQIAEAAPAQGDKRSRVVARGIAQIVDDLSELLDELGELGRARSGRLPRRAEPIDVDELVEWTARGLEALAARGGASVSASRDRGAPRRIRTDGERLRQILQLLSSSAAGVTRDGVIRARFAAAPGNGGLEVVFADSGVPIGAGEEESVFAELDPHPRNRRRHGGTKLTLALARELARLLGGDLRMKSSAGETRAILTVPDRPSSDAP